MANKKDPKVTIIYSVVHKNSEEFMSHVNNGSVVAFIKEKDAIDAAKHLTEQVKAFSPNSKYVVEILHLFNKQFYTI
jgi:hypothetical protein